MFCAAEEKEKSRPFAARLERFRLIRNGIAVGLNRLDVTDRSLAGAAIHLRVKRNLLTFIETANAGAFQSGGVHEHVLAAVVRLDKAEALLIIVELYGARHHFSKPFADADALEFETRMRPEARLIDVWRESERAPKRSEGETARSSGQISMIRS
jgi:hypothetical protein